MKFLPTLYFETRCRRCGEPSVYPIPSDNPAYHMHLEQHNFKLQKQVEDLQDDVMTLAKECLDAGVRPEVIRRADRLLETLKEILEQHRPKEKS